MPASPAMIWRLAIQRPSSTRSSTYSWSATLVSGPEAVDLAQRTAMLARDPSPGHAEDAGPVQRHPRHVHLVGI